MIKLLKKLLNKCEHRYMPYASYQEKIRNGEYVTKHIWKCTMCGKKKRFK